MEDVNKIKEASKAVWGTTPAGSVFGQGYEKGSQKFFEAILQKRFSYECDWFFDVVDFKRFAGKKVLEIGCGAGYDASMFCKHGADYTGIDITPENQLLAEKHLSYYHFDKKPTFLCQDVEEMNFKENFDYVFSFGVLHHTPNIEQALKTIYNALKKGGEAQIIVYYKHSLFYMLNTFVTQWILRGGFLRRTLAQQRSFIEYTTSTSRPLVNVYSKKEIHHLIKQAGFSIIKTDIAKLVREDLDNVFLINRLLFLIPDSFLVKLSKKFGWYISVRAIKK